MMMKRKLTNKTIGVIILAVVLFGGIFTVGSAWAYFTSNQQDTSNITLKAVDTEIEEEIDATTLTKKPMVKNTGTSDCIVRVKVEITPSKEAENITLRGVNSKDWEYNKEDGYYYYQGILEVNTLTSEVFQGVDIIDQDKMKAFDIIIYQEAIQSEILDESGSKVSAMKDGKYSQKQAMLLWQLYSEK